MVKFANGALTGLEIVSSHHDGYTISVNWYQAYPLNTSNKIAYHIYYSTAKETLFSEGVKFISVDGSLSTTLSVFEPGQLYFFCVRPVEYDPIVFDLSTDLPSYSSDLRFYPESTLRSNITSTSLIIPLVSVDDFPDSGIIKIGYEFIQYLSKDSLNNDLHLATTAQRGYNNSNARIHNTDGYDGYTYLSPIVRLLSVGEDRGHDHVYMIEADFDYDNYPFTEEDGYKQVVKDLLNSDLSYSDAQNEDFPPYDYAGWHRIDPVLLLNGYCVGSYMFGEKGCIDKYGNYNIIRGRSVQQVNNERQETLLSLTGRPVSLIKRQHTGIVCSCYGNRREYQDDRCDKCYGTKFVFGYQQYYNPRRSDGRIMIRIKPTSEKVIMQEAGLESTFNIEFWTQTAPIIHQRDFIVIYDDYGAEEFRYEISDVNRNNLLDVNLGAQQCSAIRVRKTDVIYQVRVFSDTSTMPSKLNTGISSSANGKIPPHSHEIVINEHITNINQINQETSLVQGHSHPIISGIIQPAIDHQHSIILV